MNRTTINILRLLILVVVNLLGGCATSATPTSCVPGEGPYAVTCYSSADVAGRIVDEETGEPIEGAVVVGIWQLESQGFEHSYGAAIHVVESVSDAKGHYRLKGFEGIDISRFGGGELVDRDPYVAVYAEGHKPGGASRDINEPGVGDHRVSPINGRDIRLEKGALDDWYSAYLWSNGIRKLINAGDCAIPELPALKALIINLEKTYYMQLQRFNKNNTTATNNSQKTAKEFLRATSRYKDAEERCIGR